MTGSNGRATTSTSPVPSGYGIEQVSARGRRRRRFSREGLSVAIAAVSLAAALVFNGIQVRGSAEAQRQAKTATELGLLTQLQSALTASVYSRVPYATEFQQLRAGQRSALSSQAYRAVSEEAANMDYFAWLFNNGFIRTPGAERLWGPLMICEWKQAFAPALTDPVRDLPNLFRFVQQRDRELAQLEPC
jgi:hypothetical protein